MANRNITSFIRAAAKSVSVDLTAPMCISGKCCVKSVHRTTARANEINSKFVSTKITSFSVSSTNGSSWKPGRTSTHLATWVWQNFDTLQLSFAGFVSRKKFPHANCIRKLLITLINLLQRLLRVNPLQKSSCRSWPQKHRAVRWYCVNVQNISSSRQNGLNSLPSWFNNSRFARNSQRCLRNLQNSDLKAQTPREIILRMI